MGPCSIVTSASCTGTETAKKVSHLVSGLVNSGEAEVSVFASLSILSSVDRHRGVASCTESAPYKQGQPLPYEWQARAMLDLLLSVSVVNG